MAEDKDFTFDPLSGRVGPDENLDDSSIDLSALTQAFDTTWGRSSTPYTPQHSVKFSLTGNVMIVKYAALVNFVSERNMIDQKRRYNDESLDVIKQHVKFVRDRYKELSGSTLKVKEISSSDSVEPVSMNFYNPKKTAYYRRITTFAIA